MTNLYELIRHFLFYTFEEIVTQSIPFCHIVIPLTILPVLMKNVVVFPGTPIFVNGFMYTMSHLITAWISVSLALGRVGTLGVAKIFFNKIPIP
jgi:ferredoxin-type protein NapH